MKKYRIISLLLCVVTLISLTVLTSSATVDPEPKWEYDSKQDVITHGNIEYTPYDLGSFMEIEPMHMIVERNTLDYSISVVPSSKDVVVYTSNRYYERRVFTTKDGSSILNELANKSSDSLMIFDYESNKYGKLPSDFIKNIQSHPGDLRDITGLEIQNAEYHFIKGYDKTQTISMIMGVVVRFNYDEMYFIDAEGLITTNYAGEYVISPTAEVKGYGLVNYEMSTFQKSLGTMTRFEQQIEYNEKEPIDELPSNVWDAFFWAIYVIFGVVVPVLGIVLCIIQIAGKKARIYGRHMVRNLILTVLLTIWIIVVAIVVIMIFA